MKRLKRILKGWDHQLQHVIRNRCLVLDFLVICCVKFVALKSIYRPHPKDGGKVLLSVCQSTPRGGGEGTLISGQDGGPHQQEGSTPTSAGRRWPPTRIPGQDKGIHPQLEQDSVYSLCGGWYASCVYTGGLSIFVFGKRVTISKSDDVILCEMNEKQNIAGCFLLYFTKYC